MNAAATGDNRRQIETMTTESKLYTELNSLREEVRALKEQVAAYTARPITLTDHPHIVRIQGVRGGEPIVRDAYISVRAIVERTRLGETPEQILEAYEKLTLAQVYDALSYYHDHTDEIEGYIHANEEALKRVIKANKAETKRHKRRRLSRVKRGNGHATR